MVATLSVSEQVSGNNSDIEGLVEVERLVALGASRTDIGQGEVGWVVLADPDGNEFCVTR